MGSLLLLNAPQGMQFGIDNQYWTVGPLFKGVKLIPKGTHFVYFALKDEQYAARMGFFIHVKGIDKAVHDQEKQRQQMLNQIIVRTWDDELQAFTRLQSEADECAYKEGVLNMDFDRNLGAYPMDNYSAWLQLASFISAEVMERVQPINDRIILSE